MGGINEESSQLITAATPVEGSYAPSSASVAEPFAMPGSVTISSADVVNPETLPESSPGETARLHAALSHPYFSNHPTQTAASGVGDIVIDNRPGGKAGGGISKLMISAIVGVAVVLAAGAALFTILSSGSSDSGSRKKVTAQDVKNSFSAYVDYVEHGPDGYTNADEWFVATLTESNYVRSELLGYTKTAVEQFEQFKADFEASSLTGNQELQHLITINGNMIDTLVNYGTLQILVAENLRTYLNDGLNAAEEQISQMGITPTNPVTQVTNDLLVTYMENELVITQIYDEHGCVAAKMVIGVCVASIEDEQVDSLRIQNDLLDLRLSAQHRALVEDFVENVALIDKELNE